MENIKSSLTFNSNQTGLNSQATDQTPNPFGANPFAAASAKVQQVNRANSLIPASVQNLIPSNPKERVRIIMRMPASKQQDKHFCELAQNPYLDGKSRLAAAMKLKDTKRRNMILKELAQDQSLKGSIRLKAVDKISNCEMRKEMFAELAQDNRLDEAYRAEAELSIAFRIAVEKEIQSLEVSIQNMNLNEDQKAKPGIAVEAKLEPEEKVEAVKVEEVVVVLAPEQPVENDDAPPIQIDPADLERKERALLAIVQDTDLDQHISQGISAKSYRLEAALKLAPGQRREEALAFLAQGKDWGKVYSNHNHTYVCSHPATYAKLRLEAALALAPGQRREDILALLAQDKDLNHSYSIQNNNLTVYKNCRLEAALALNPGQRKEDILALLAQDKDCPRLEAALALVPGQRREEILAFLAQNKDLRQSENYFGGKLNKSYYIVNPALHMQAALALAPGQRREDILALLAQDKDFMKATYSVPSNNGNVQKNCALTAALNMTSGQRKEEILALIAQDKNLSANYRLEAANSMAGGQAEEGNQQ